MADAGKLAEIEKICFSLPWSLSQCANSLRQNSFAAFGLLRDERLLAYVSIYHAVPEMEILNLAVLPGFRRMGLGGRILSLVLQAGAKMGMQKAALEVREHNLPALALYKKLGFMQTGIRKNYYPDNRENALILTFVFNN